MLFLHWRNGRNFSSLTGLAGGLPLQLLNSIPWRLDKNAEKLCAKYSDNHYVCLYRGSRALNEENKFIEIPEE